MTDKCCRKLDGIDLNKVNLRKKVIASLFDWSCGMWEKTLCFTWGQCCTKMVTAWICSHQETTTFWGVRSNISFLKSKVQNPTQNVLLKTLIRDQYTSLINTIDYCFASSNFWGKTDFIAPLAHIQFFYFVILALSLVCLDLSNIHYPNMGSTAVYRVVKAGYSTNVRKETCREVREVDAVVTWKVLSND